MPTFPYPIEISGLDLIHTHSVETTVNSGVFFTIAPSLLLRHLGVDPIATRSFEMTDGTRRELDIGHAYIAIDGRSSPTIVGFGHDSGPFLLGKYTLLGLAIAADADAKGFVSLEPLPL